MYLQAWTIDFMAPYSVGAQLGTQETDAQNQNACPIKKQLEILLFVLHYINRI